MSYVLISVLGVSGNNKTWSPASENIPLYEETYTHPPKKMLLGNFMGPQDLEGMTNSVKMVSPFPLYKLQSFLWFMSPL